MNVKIDIQELNYILDHTPADQNIMLAGRHGIGKSEILTSYFNKRGLPVVALFLGQMSDPGDLIGLPDKSGEITVFRPPYWFPVDGKPIVLFLDELNRARPEVLQTIMDLALNKKLAGRQLPKGSRIIAAVNEGEEYQLTDLDPALVSRFNIFRFEPSVEEWIQWARNNQLDNRVITFIRENSNWLDKDPSLEDSSDLGLDKTPDRRAWKRVSDVIKGREQLDKVDIKLVASIVGVRASRLFMSKLNQIKNIDAKHFLNDFDAHIPILLEMKLHNYQILNEDILIYLSSLEIDTDNADILGSNLMKYIYFLLNKHKNEVLASFSNLLQQTRYDKASDFIMENCKEVIKIAMRYTSNIR